MRVPWNRFSPTCNRVDRICHTGIEFHITTGALARWKDAATGGKLFQQFVRIRGKPLKRLKSLGTFFHRAEAPVLMRTGLVRWESSGLWRLEAPMTETRSYS
jgi:hypothetical protein